jgi:hypothetical protein
MAAAWRVALDEGAFRQLVAGQVLKVIVGDGDRIEISVASVGFIPMLRAVLDGMTPGQPKGPPDPPQAREFLPPRNQRR